MRTPRIPRAARRTAALALLYILSMPSAHSAIISWDAGTGDWNTAANWDPAQVPSGAGDAAIIANGGTAQITGAVPTLGDVIVGHTNGTSGTLEITGGGTLTTNNASAAIGNFAGSTGTVLVDGTGSAWSTGSFGVSIGSEGTGTLTVRNGGTVTFGNTLVGFTGAGTLNLEGTAGNRGMITASQVEHFAGTGVVNFDGGVVQLSGNQANLFGGFAAGDVTLNAGGGFIDTQAFSVVTAASMDGTGGLTKQGAGTLTLTGANTYTGGTTVNFGTLDVDGGSISHAGSTVYVGSATGDDGTLLIQGSGTVNSIAGRIGLDAGSTGEATVTGSGSTWTTASIVVGVDGDGLLAVEAGGAVNNGAGFIGSDAGSTGVVTVDGAGSTWTNTGALNVAFDGDATLVVSAGGVVTDTSGNIGSETGSTGMATVTGAGSTWTNSSFMNVGRAGTGTLIIEDGGAVSNDNAIIGTNVGSTGTVTVTGTGSTWTNSSSLFVGESGTGTLTIADGGDVSNNNDALIGFNTGSTGAVTVTGAGSTWMNTSALLIGFDGSGTLTIGDGGTVIAAAIVVSNLAGSNGSLNLNGTAGNRGTLATSQLEGGNGTRAVEFDGGVLLLTGSQANLLAGFAAGDVTLNAGGGFIDTQAFSVASAAAMDGAGGMTKQGAGTLTLTGANTYTGTTTISDGELVFDGGSNTIGGITAAVGNLVIQNGATVTSDNGFVGRTGIGSAIATVTGAGSLWQTTGDLQVSEIIPTPISGVGGTLRVENGAEVQVGGELFLDIAGVLEIDGASQVTAANGLRSFASMIRVLSDGLLNIPDIEIVTGSGIDTNGFDVTYAGDMSVDGVGGFQKNGTGTLTLTGNHADTELQGVVLGGTLLIDGSFAGSMSVNAATTLGGSGSVGSVTMNGGTFAPGNSIGTTTVTGDVDFSGGGTYEVEVNDAGQSDLIDATGTATLTGGSVSVLAENGDYAPQTEYLILTADSGVTGTFADVTANFAFLTPSLSYDANNVFLTLALNTVQPTVDFTSVVETPNQAAVATVLNDIGIAAGGDFQEVMDALLVLSPGQARLAFDQLSGIQHTHALYAARQALRGLTRLSFGRLGGDGRNPGLSGLTFAFSDAPWAQQLQSQWLSMLDGAGAAMQERGVWVRGYGVWGGIDGTENARGGSYDSAGLALGFDADFGEHWMAGVSGGYAGTDTDSFGAELEDDTFQLAGYASFRQSTWYAHGFIGHAWHDVDSTRPVSFGGFDSVSDADYDMTTFSAALEVGYDFALAEKTTVTPFAALDYARSHRDSFTESGAAGLDVDGETAYSFRPVFGFRLAHSWTTDTGSKIEPVVYAAYAHEMMDDVSRVQGTFANAAADGFIIDGPDTDRGRFLAGAAINTALTQRAWLTLGWDADLAGSDVAHAASATFRYRW